MHQPVLDLNEDQIDRSVYGNGDSDDADDSTQASSNDIDDNEIFNDCMKRLVRVWILADGLRHVKAANMTINTIYSVRCQYGKLSAYKVIRSVWTSTPKDSNLRRLFRDLYVHEGSGCLLIDAEDVLPKTFLIEVIEEFWRVVLANNAVHYEGRNVRDRIHVGYIQGKYLQSTR